MLTHTLSHRFHRSGLLAQLRLVLRPRLTGLHQGRPSPALGLLADSFSCRFVTKGPGLLLVFGCEPTFSSYRLSVQLLLNILILPCLGRKNRTAASVLLNPWKLLRLVGEQHGCLSLCLHLPGPKQRSEHRTQGLEDKVHREHRRGHLPRGWGGVGSHDCTKSSQCSNSLRSSKIILPDSATAPFV